MVRGPTAFGGISFRNYQAAAGLGVFMTRGFVLAGSSLLFLSLTFAQTKPDLSGTWKLDPLRTRFNELPEAKSLTLKIEHQEPKIRIAINNNGDGDAASSTLYLTTGAAEQKVMLAGQPATATALWDKWTGDKLAIEIKRKTPEGESVITRQLKVSPDGKMMTTILTVKDKTGEKKAYEFFFKE